MNTINRLTLNLAALTVALGSAAPGWAQQPQQNYYKAASGLQGKTVFLPTGTTFEGRIEQTISSSKSHQGERFSIVTASPVLGNGSDVIIPAGSKVLGEVVEAIPHDQVKHPKGFKPYGKLRVQITNLQTPDGLNYPLVGSLVPEEFSQGKTHRPNQILGGGVGYAGSQTSFAAVGPGMGKPGGGRGGPQLVTKQDLMRDPLFGKDQQQNNNQGNERFRSLVPRGHDVFVFAGSPLSIRLDAPLKIGVANAPGAESVYQAATDQSNQGGRRFSREAPQPPPQQQPAPTGALDQSQQGGLPFLQPSPQLPAPGAPGSSGPLPLPGAPVNTAPPQAGSLPPADQSQAAGAPNTLPFPAPSNTAPPPQSVQQPLPQPSQLQPPLQQPQGQSAPGSSF